MERTFNVGDVVRIKTWGAMEEQFGLTEYGDINCKFTFVHSMGNLCSKLATIKELGSDGKVVLDFDDGSQNDDDWDYSTDMIEHVDGVNILETINGTDGNKCIRFTIGNYGGTFEYYGFGNRCHLRPMTDDKYLPEIALYFGESDFKIQTISNGDADMNTVKKVIAGYETAMRVVRTLKEYFNVK